MNDQLPYSITPKPGLRTKYRFHEARNGKGAFATESIGRNETIRFMTGELVSVYEMLRRVRSGVLRHDDPLQIDDYIFMICDEESHYFNHSCAPNAAMRGYNELFAISEINPNEEITFDYSTVVGISPMDFLWKMKCNCGAASCRKIISTIYTVPPDRLREYNLLGALPDFIVKQLTSLSNPYGPLIMKLTEKEHLSS